MKTIICGSGDVGYSIADKLSKENFEVTVVDEPSAKLNKISENLDVKVISGQPSLPSVLLNAGANDFIKKPIKIKNLLARIRTHLKSNKAKESTIINWGKLYVNKHNFTIQIDSSTIKLTKSEFKILTTLMEKENKIFSRNQLLDTINDDNVILNDRIIDVHINSIRKKLSKYRTIIETVVGVGFIANRSTN